MTDALKLYLRYASAALRGQMQYRASFVMQIMGHALVQLTEFIGLWAMFARFGHLEGWRLAEAAFLYGVVHTAFPINELITGGFDNFGRMIRRGGFDRLLLRPRSTVLQLAGQEFQIRRFGSLFQGVAILTWAAIALQIDWSLWRIGLFGLTIAGAAAMFAGLFIIQATIAFWTIESLEIMNALTYGGRETAQFPMPIYHTWFRRFFIFVVPLACVCYFPCVAIMGRPEPLGSPLWFQCAAPLTGFAFLALALAAWRFGVRHYTSTGS